MTYQANPKAWTRPSPLAALSLPGGMLAGTRVLTADGVKRIEEVHVGDRVIARSGLQRVAGVLSSPAHRTPLVCIHAGTSLIPNATEDLILAASQPLYLRGRAAFTHTGRSEALIAAGRIADGIEVMRCVLPDAADLRVLRLVFADAEVFYADGLELGSGIPAPRRPVMA
jgi:hypothetical protein